MTGKRWAALAISSCMLLLCVGSALAALAEAPKKGDINNDGVINSADARLLWRYLDSGYVLSTDQITRADMNSNGLVNPIDAKLLWQAACSETDSDDPSSSEQTSTSDTSSSEADSSSPQEEPPSDTTESSSIVDTTEDPTTTTEEPTTTTTEEPTTTTEEPTEPPTTTTAEPTKPPATTKTPTKPTSATADDPSTRPTAQTPPMPEAVTSPPTPTLQNSTVKEATYMRNIRIRAETASASETYDCSTRKGLQLGIAAAVKYEMGASWYAVNSTEAWKAHAVISYSHIARECYSDEHSPKVFVVRTAPIDLNNYNDKRLYDAVGEVLGIKVMLPNASSNFGKLPHCFYFASAAGATSSCHNVWTENLPYAQSVWSPETVELMYKYPTSGDFDRLYSYTIEEIMSEMEQYLGQTLYRDTQEDAFSLYATKWDGPYMARSNLYYLSGDYKVYVTGMQLRSGLGLGTHALLVTDEKDGVMSIQMRGYGHGCGLSQAGSAILANEYGWTYDQIIAHYFSITDTSECQICLPKF